MNLRILKKLSKRAAPLLAHFGVGHVELFLSERWEGYTGLLIRDRTCWMRGRSAHGEIWGHEVKRPARDGNGWVCMRPPNTTLKGTPMVGQMSAGEEPEWNEHTALEELMDCVRWSGKPDTMTNAEWALALRITRVTPITRAEISEMLEDMHDAAKGDPALMEEDAC
ncbi:hypothetical protein ABNQ39_11265 [Azospirillum sp. A26]|uniref:hypothetical protein n=1 Tax=Azospirillum sp. A26 TaxID=3160607 RepID=UPI00366C1623